jgi:hypothetical protein
MGSRDRVGLGVGQKLYRYRRASDYARGGTVANVLFVVSFAPRMETLHRALADADRSSEWDLVRAHWEDWPLLVTTTDELEQARPLDRIWRWIDQPDGFAMRLADLLPSHA